MAKAMGAKRMAKATKRVAFWHHAPAWGTLLTHPGQLGSGRAGNAAKDTGSLEGHREPKALR